MKTALLLLAVSLLAAPLGAQSTGTLTAHSIPSKALAANLVGDPGTGRVEVYLPRSYARETTRRYPVLFLLHGIQGTSADWTRPGYSEMTIQGLMDSLTAAGSVKEMIVVVPTGNNVFAGSYYGNSPVTGNWEDWLSGELVAWVDSAFRTIPNAASRGVAGHSMGGLGAITMALRHSDVFGAAYAMSPCCLAGVADISAANEVWRRMAGFKTIAALKEAEKQGDLYPIAVIGLSAVMSPNPRNPPLFVDLPYEFRGDSIRPVEAVVARWRPKFPVAQVGSSRESLTRLRAPLRIDYGFDDQFPHIPPAVQMFVDSLSAHKVSYRLDAYDGDHRNRIRARMTRIVLPFFSAVLADR